MTNETQPHLKIVSQKLSADEALGKLHEVVDGDQSPPTEADLVKGALRALFAAPTNGTPPELPIMKLQGYTAALRRTEHPAAGQVEHAVATAADLALKAVTQIEPPSRPPLRTRISDRVIRK